MSIGYKTLNELNHLAEKYGWEKKKLTLRDINKMTSDEADWHGRVNAAEFERALSEDKTKAETKRSAEQSRIDRAWSDEGGTEEDHKEAMRQAILFCDAHPQFRKDLESNRVALVDFLKERKLAPNPQNFRDAFQTLGREGKLVLSPSKVGIIRVRLSNGDVISIRKEELRTHKSSGNHTYGRDSNVQVLEDEDVTGARLSGHSLLDVLLSPHSPAIQAQREQAASSADDYYKERIELHETRVPPLVAGRLRQYVATLAEKHPEMLQNDNNGAKLSAYLAEKQLALNLNNLEVAYAALRNADAIELRNDAVASSSGTKFIDYGNVHLPHGHRQAELPEKESLAYKVRKMNSKEYEEFIANPTNRRAIDGAAAAR